jgi:fumarate reductase subunit D
VGGMISEIIIGIATLIIGFMLGYGIKEREVE